MKTFNTAGACIPGKHYMIDPLKRLSEVENLIEEELYFTIHAPRQTGKTTYLNALALKLNSDGNRIALAVSVEQAGYDSITVEKANELLIACVYKAARINLPGEYWPENPGNKEFINLNHYLTGWCESQEKPIVLFIDEIDALMDDVLISVLRQFRDGYQIRPGHFPSSIILVGLRDVRDYKAAIREDMSSMGTSSPFNIKSDSLFLTDFNKENVFQLLEQHTEATGQVFPVEVKEEIFRLTAGQPWLTNALSRQMVAKILNYDFSRPITMELLSEAKTQLILRRDTHLDSLVDKLKEERVKRIVQAIINGESVRYDSLEDDIKYVRDLGIVGQTDPLQFSNPIYAEIIPRIMAYTIQASIPMEIQTPWFLKDTDTDELDMKKVLIAFQGFYRENSESWTDRFIFKESAHQLMLMAFLQRIVNSGGEITREMALGNGRMDLLVKFRKQRTAIEIKIKRGEQSIEKAKHQLSNYLDRLGLKEGYLVIFDPSDLEWEKKNYINEITYNDKTIIMVGN